MANNSICNIEGCGKAVLARALCQMHYQRWRKHGDATALKRPANGTPLTFMEYAIGYECEDCLMWPHNRGGGGYPIVRIDGKKIYAHRKVCEAVNGPEPTVGMDAAHSCGNGHLGCVNPKHLRWATRAENVADKITHGTLSNKLTESDVRSIRALRGKMTHREISERFGIARGSVSNIQLRQTWAWLT